MRHLGVLKGSGLLESIERELRRASYEFDGYLIHPAQVVGSGEVHIAAEVLSEAFGRKDLILRAWQGRGLGEKQDCKRQQATSSRKTAQIAG